MKLLVEQSKKEKLDENIIDGVILSLENFSVQSEVYYSIDEIKQISIDYKGLEIFVNINKNISNNEVEEIKGILKQLDELNVKGIFFYDLAILQLKKELGLKIDLVWNQTHMVNNYKTCNYYYSKGVKYALLGKEITLKEIEEIIANSSIVSMVEVVSMPSVAFSKRGLITNYYKDLNKDSFSKLEITEKITSKKYELTEDDNGTGFILKDVVNGTSVIKDLYNIKTPYIIMREYGIDQKLFYELLKDTKKYIDGNCQDSEYVEKYKKLGDYTNFFFQKTIYRVKKNG